MELILFLIAVPGVVVLIDFIGFLITGRRVVHKIILRIAEVGAMIILPWLYGDFGGKNDCCSESTIFSPKHQLTIGVITILCLFAYFYSSYRTKIAPPLLEIIINCLLFIGIILNIFIAIHTKEAWLAIGGDMPVILLAILVLIKNQKIFIAHSQQVSYTPGNKIESIAWKILTLQPVLKYPLIFLLCLPVLIILAALLLLIGQKPDSLIRAFTDTYKHGLSQWDYKCDNVECGGHYLCSVAANGHKRIVKPQRLGIRNGRPIICNRQLLISNAFEDILQEKLPFTHAIIRKQYNKVGNFIHAYYHIFNNKYLSDFIYILMKPVEWFFLIVLYTVDRKPENRIAKQYLNNWHRQQIDNG